MAFSNAGMEFSGAKLFAPLCAKTIGWFKYDSLPIDL
jgi:hypothetical protein